MNNAIKKNPKVGMDGKSSNNVANESMSKDQYETAFLKSVTHGITYQVKILTWVAWKLLCKSEASIKNWRIATEVRNARGLHDLVLRYEIDDASRQISGTSNNKRMYRFVQIKHRLCLKKDDDISISCLTSREKKNQYSLIYLFRSYINMLGNFENIMPEQIENMTIFTNVDMGAIRFLVPVDKDKILDFEGKGKRYRIDMDRFLKNNQNIIEHLQKIMPNNNLICDFLSKLVFAVSQPSESELEELITKEMGKIFSVPQIFYNDLYKNMIEWFLVYDDGKAPYLTEERLMQYLRDTQNMLTKAKKADMHTIHDAPILSEVFSLLSI